jgi:hypothetical protein
MGKRNDKIIQTNKGERMNNSLPSQLICYPSDWPKHFNANTEPCDMLQGPCCCGAWHDLNEWGKLLGEKK